MAALLGKDRLKPNEDVNADMEEIGRILKKLEKEENSLNALTSEENHTLDRLHRRVQQFQGAMKTPFTQGAAGRVQRPLHVLAGRREGSAEVGQ